MFGRLTRRQRRLALTGGVALAFVTFAGAIVLLTRRPAPAYRPGESIEGLTSELTRSLPPDRPRVTFVDVSREAGIRFQHFAGERTSQLPEDMGSGAAWGDYNNDGWPDVFIVNLVGPITLTPEAARRSPARCALYRNNRDGTFTDVAVEAGVDLRAWGMGAEWGDYDNDGWLDLVVATYGEIVLYRNNGDGTFGDRTRAAALAGRRGFWSGVAWGDFDRDGFLDLYVTGYVRYSPPGESAASPQHDVENPAGINPNSFPPERNLLFRNLRDGTFREVAVAARVLGERGKSLEAAWVDLDEDDWPDLYVANDVTDNQLFRNLGDGTFADVSHQARVADYRSAMGLAVGDWDGDQDQDIFITHWIAQENALYGNLRNRSPRGRAAGGPALQFMDEADRYGLGQISLDFVGWGTFFFDYDNDGRLDLFVANGHTFQRRDAPRQLVAQTAQLFWNRGAAEGFYDVSPVSGDYFRTPHVGRGAAFADYDRDGDLDVLVVNHGGPATLLRNDGGNRNRWLDVRLEGRRTNRSAVGARIRVLAGKSTWVREVGAQASYLSQNDPTEHFGLGSLADVDSVVVLWPGGARQVVTRVPSGRTVTVVEGASVGAAPGTPLDTAAARAGVREFWEVYRGATRLRTAGRFDAARDAYRRALQLDARHEDALYYLGNMELELGRYAEARSAWERLVELNPRSARAHSRLGDLHACADVGAPYDVARAEAEFRRALQLNREETGPLLRLGELALLRGDFSGAMSHFDAVIGSHSRSAAAHLLEGYVAWKRRQPERAAARFRTAVDVARQTRSVQRFPGEGDTRRGIAPAVARSSRCELFEAHIEQLSGVADADLVVRMNEIYRQLDGLLARLAARARS